MAKKILVVGGVAGGASAAARSRRLSEDDQIIMFERGPHVSFSNCSLPYHLSGVVPQSDSLLFMNPGKFSALYRIDARIFQEVIAINRDKKTVTVKKLDDNTTYEESYDKLVIAPGAHPMIPPIEGIDQANVHTVHNVVDTVALKKAVDSGAKNIAVIGAGFIGVEVAVNLREFGANVYLIETLNQIMRTFDYDMVQILHKDLMDHGVKVMLGEKVASLTKNQVILASGAKIDVDLVVMSTGVVPETKLIKDAGLAVGTTGAIAINEACQTGDPDIYAVGDAVEVTNAITEDKMKLALAWPAQIQARGAADHLNGKTFKQLAYIGTSCIKVFGYNAASTGLTEDYIRDFGLKIDYDAVMIAPMDSVSIMPNSSPIFLKVIFEKGTGKILGAQAIGKGNVDKRIDVIATVMKYNGTVRDLPDLELCYAPPFNTVKDAVNYAGYVGCNLMDKMFKQVLPYDIRGLVESGAFIIDIRETEELAEGTIINSKSIPYSSLRSRLNEIPKDEPIYVTCRTGQRSYSAVLALQYLGFKDVYNIAGGFLSLSFHEYFNDKMQNRKSILTGYNFN